MSNIVSSKRSASHSESPSRFRLGIDIGGTFTDAVLVGMPSGEIWTAKCLTTEQPEDGALQAAERVLELAEVSLGDVETVVHATTLASNLVLQRRGSKVGLITTAGFEDILAMRREVRYDSWTLRATFVEPLVDQENCVGVQQRILTDGTEYRAVDLESVKSAIKVLQENSVEAFAVCLLHSYANDSHERLIGDLVREIVGDEASVSLSSMINPEIREYERTSTTVINAYISTKIGDYQKRLERELELRGYAGKLHVMVSSGGVNTTDLTSKFPVRLLESGPVAGVLAATWYGNELKRDALVALDLGGTTAKACLIRNGVAMRSRAIEVARASRYVKGSGLPVQTPSIDLLEIGSGGGSIAWVDALGFLKVGPQSAEARPGPACYGLGGTAPTVTDANLYLGYLDAERFAGGTMRLDLEAAQTALAKLASELGLSPDDCALAVIDMVNESMADAVRVHLAEHNVDAQSTVLLASGGGGPMHSASVARKLGISEVIIPANAGVLSALGLLIAPPAVDYAKSFITEIGDSTDWAHIGRVLSEMETDARRGVSEAGVAEADIEIVRSADLRWVGQTHALTLELPSGPLDESSIKVIEEAFNAESSRLYGAALRPTVLEALTWRVNAVSTRPQSTVVRHHSVDKGTSEARSRQIRIQDYGLVNAQIVDRLNVGFGFEAEGPLLVEQPEYTCLVAPGDKVRIDELGNLIITIGKV
jgi:5-oxoprolinase (ATP-hydrolysing)